MRNFRIMMMIVAILMASTSLTAQVQRVTTTLNGSGQVGMWGFPCTLTITPDGKGVIKGEATKEVSAVTINFKTQQRDILYEAIKGNGFMWSYIKDITVSPFSMKEKEQHSTITPKGNGKFNGITDTNTKDIKFYVRFPIATDRRQSVLDINFTFTKNVTNR